jgi:nitrite reductase/ring-hydroxylating ferredoxin subunit
MVDDREGSNTRADAPGADPCAGCAAASSRRQFFGKMSGALVVAMIGAELPGVVGRAFDVQAASSVQVGATEHSYPLPAADGVSIDRNTQVILVRFQQHVYAFNLACPHENTALRWRDKDRRFQCPKHESKYQPDGTFISGRATRNMDRFAIRHDGDAVIVDLSKLYRSDQNRPEWTAATLQL